MKIKKYSEFYDEASKCLDNCQMKVIHKTEGLIKLLDHINTQIIHATIDKQNKKEQPALIKS